MEYVSISKEEYDQLIRYKNIVNTIEEEIHEELKVQPLTDKKAIEKIEKLRKEQKEGKRKIISDADFTAKYKHLL